MSVCRSRSQSRALHPCRSPSRSSCSMARVAAASHFSSVVGCFHLGLGDPGSNSSSESEALRTCSALSSSFLSSSHASALDCGVMAVCVCAGMGVHGRTVVNYLVFRSLCPERPYDELFITLCVRAGIAEASAISMALRLALPFPLLLGFSFSHDTLVTSRGIR